MIIDVSTHFLLQKMPNKVSVCSCVEATTPPAVPSSAMGSTEAPNCPWDSKRELSSGSWHDRGQERQKPIMAAAEQKYRAQRRSGPPVSDK